MAKAAFYVLAICLIICCIGQRTSFACLTYHTDKFVATGCGDSDCVFQTCNDGFAPNMDELFQHSSEQFASLISGWQTSYTSPVRNLQLAKVKSRRELTSETERHLQLNALLAAAWQK